MGLMSMTGFGRAEGGLWGKPVSVEIKAVNHRFSEVQLRLPRELSHVEHLLEERVCGVVGRGRADVVIRLGSGRVKECPAAMKVDGEAARAYVSLYRELARETGLDGEITLEWLAQLPGVLLSEGAAESPEETFAELEPLLNEALEQLAEVRSREGDGLMASLLSHIEEAGRLVAGISRRAPHLPDSLQQRVSERLSRLAQDVVDPARLAQEVAFLAEKADISEELDRLGIHLGTFRDSIEAADGPVGRKLDFLCQELNREANTIGSKSHDAEISSATVELKTAIERLREQVQNVQ